MTPCQKRGKHDLRTLRYFRGIDGNYWKEEKCQLCKYGDMYITEAPQLVDPPKFSHQ